MTRQMRHYARSTWGKDETYVLHQQNHVDVQPESTQTVTNQAVSDEQARTLSQIIDECGLSQTLEAIALIADQNADNTFGRHAAMWVHAGAYLTTLVIILEQWVNRL